MTDKHIDDLHDEYVAALKRHRELHQRWERIFPTTERSRGQEAPMILPAQINLEEELRVAWNDYLAKRKAYQAALRNQTG